MAILDELNWIYFPKTQRMPKILDGVIDVFKENFDEIRTDQKKIKSNDVLKILIGSLKDRNFRVEGSKSKIKMPVLYGEKNIPSKYFEVDAFDEEGRPNHKNGISSNPGVYFLGLPWLSKRGSSFIFGVWEDAKFLAEYIAQNDL